MHASICAIEFYLPTNTLTTEDLTMLFPEWPAERIAEKTGIRTRHIAAADECASDLAVKAAERLFGSGVCSRREIDFILFCTQSQDYVLPTTACLLQDRLSIPTSAGCFDFNLGCSGFVYGLGIAEGLIASGQAKMVLLLTAETYSKYLDEYDKNTRVLFGDGAAATLVTAVDTPVPLIGPFVYGSDGSGGMDLVVPNSGSRVKPDSRDSLRPFGSRGNGTGYLSMNGNNVFQFAVSVVPIAVRALLEKAQLTIEEIDLFVFHQANATILKEIQAALGIKQSRMEIALEKCGNTVSSTIPIALKQAQIGGRLQRGSIVLVAGFGVGYSWGATILRWTQD
jgi:3-oxoacyl-[acyl-carrier-protein] synthase III